MRRTIHARKITNAARAGSSPRVDVAWASASRAAELGDRECFLLSPEIFVEVLSFGNTEDEMKEKIALYFDSGAQEVWLCDTLGGMSFFASPERAVERSALCPQFPSDLSISG